MIPPQQLHTLRKFPEQEWKHAESDEWHRLCEALSAYRSNNELIYFPLARKWEVASALQKAIRRGDHALGLRLTSIIRGMRPEDHAYFWRRLPVIACEDVGDGAMELTKFVIVCSSIFTPKKSQHFLLDVFEFLVTRLCAAASRSRLACSLTSIEELSSLGHVPAVPRPDDNQIRCVMHGRIESLSRATQGWEHWQRRNDWRGARLLRFIDLQMPFRYERRQRQPLPSIELHGLPNYSYDMYTRSGREVLRKCLLSPTVEPEIRAILRSPTVRDPLIAAGEALFFAEGGYVAGEQAYSPVNDLLHRLYAARFGLQAVAWTSLIESMQLSLMSGSIDEIRGEELENRYSQGLLFA